MDRKILMSLIWSIGMDLEKELPTSFSRSDSDVKTPTTNLLRLMTPMTPK
jgi:hypothetical protein